MSFLKDKITLLKTFWGSLSTTSRRLIISYIPVMFFTPQFFIDGIIILILNLFGYISFFYVHWYLKSITILKLYRNLTGVLWISLEDPTFGYYYKKLSEDYYNIDQYPNNKDMIIINKQELIDEFFPDEPWRLTYSHSNKYHLFESEEQILKRKRRDSIIDEVLEENLD